MSVNYKRLTKRAAEASGFDQKIWVWENPNEQKFASLSMFALLANL